MRRSITTESFSVLTSEVNIFMLTSEVEVKIEAKTKWRSDLNREQVDILPQKILVIALTRAKSAQNFSS